MDVKQIEYIVKIADEHSITRAAEKLFITQSALNQQLLRLEKELGAPLFHRSKTDMQPTAVGEVYLEHARQILRIKQEAYTIISDMTETQKGRLSIGFTSGRGLEMFTHIYPRFHLAFPGVVVEPRELSVRQQQQQIAQGNLTLGFLTLTERQRTGDEHIVLCREELVLAVPAGHPLTTMAAPTDQPAAVPAGKSLAVSADHSPPASTRSPLATLNPALLEFEPFVLMYKESTSRATVDDIFRSSGFVPNVLFETSNNRAILSMIQARLCCGVLPYYYVKDHPEGICCFSFPSRPAWDVVASYRKDTYLSAAAKYFIELAREFWT